MSEKPNDPSTWSPPIEVQQQCVVHDDLTMTDDQCQAVEQGESLHITRKAIEKAILFSRHFARQSKEISFAFAVLRAAPHLIIDTMLYPEQELSAGHTTATGRGINDTRRRALRDKRLLCNSGHSHIGQVYSSQTDLKRMHELAKVRDGYRTAQQAELVGSIVPRESEDDETYTYEVKLKSRLPGAGRISITTDQPLDEETTEVRLCLDETWTTACSFLTFNSAGQVHVPMFRLEVCPKCGGSHRASFDPSSVVVHIHNDGGLTEAEIESVKAEIAAMIDITPTFGTSTIAMAGMPGTEPSNATNSIFPTKSDRPTTPQTASQAPASQARPYVVSRGDTQFIVPAVVMEKAMHVVPELRRLCEDAAQAEADPSGSIVPSETPLDEGESR